ncbi:MAG: energy transducer TonB [Sphingobium limneticum]
MIVRKPTDWVAAFGSLTITGGMVAALMAVSIIAQTPEKKRPLTVISLTAAAPPAPEPAAAEPEIVPVIQEPVPAAPVPIIHVAHSAPIALAPAISPPKLSLPAVIAPAGRGESTSVPITPPGFDADYLNNPPPRYPPGSRRLREEGEVLLKVLVSPAGRSREVLIARSSGHARLDDAAQNAVRRWRFTPARQEGSPVTAWVLVPLTFSLS